MVRDADLSRCADLLKQMSELDPPAPGVRPVCATVLCAQRVDENLLDLLQQLSHSSSTAGGWVTSEDDAPSTSGIAADVKASTLVDCTLFTILLQVAGLV